MRTHWIRALMVATPLGLLAASAPCDDAARAGDTAMPLPVARTSILRDEDAVYVVDGRVRIPKGVELTILRGIRIVGRGERPTLEIEGDLKVHGVFGAPVAFDGVTVEPMAAFGAIKMSQVVFRNGGGIRTAKDGACSGYFMIEMTDFIDRATLDVALSRGTLEMSLICADTPVSIRAVDDPATTGNTVKVEIRGCKQVSPCACPHGDWRVGFRGGLEVASANEMIVRESRLGGETVSIRDWRKKLIFDGNKVDATRLEFTQPVAGRFRTAQFLKCDSYGTAVRFQAPPRRKLETEDVTLDRWHFAGTGGGGALARDRITDGTGAPAENGVRVTLGKVNDRPVALGGPAPK